jgi:hypothetical protein
MSNPRRNSCARYLVEHGECLATTGRGNGRGNGGQLEMPQDTRDHRLLGDDGNDAQGAPSAKRTGAHIQTHIPQSLV